MFWYWKNCENEPNGVAVGGDLVGPGEIGERLAVRGHGEDVGVSFPVGGRPAADLGVGAAPVGESAAGSAVDRDEVDLRDQAPPSRVREVAAVGGEAGMADLGAVDGEPPGAAPAVERGQPEVVLGDKAQEVSVEVRQAQIAHVPMLFRGTDRSNL